MSNTVVVRARIDKKVKDEATAVLAAIGLTVSDAVRLMMIRIVMEKKLPFSPLIPDAEIIAAIEETRRRGGIRTSSAVDERIASLNDGDEDK